MDKLLPVVMLLLSAGCQTENRTEQMRQIAKTPCARPAWVDTSLFPLAEATTSADARGPAGSTAQSSAIVVQLGSKKALGEVCKKLGLRVLPSRQSLMLGSHTGAELVQRLREAPDVRMIHLPPASRPEGRSALTGCWTETGEGAVYLVDVESVSEDTCRIRFSVQGNYPPMGSWNGSSKQWQVTDKVVLSPGQWWLNVVWADGTEDVIVALVHLDWIASVRAEHVSGNDMQQ